jgi:hypothetical protein
MYRFADRMFSTARVLLAVFLLTSQGLLAAHSLQHLGPADESPCAVCSVGANLHGGAADVHDAIVATPTSTLYPHPEESEPVSAVFPAHPARGPPLSH